jgi:phage replication initiation protein
MCIVLIGLTEMRILPFQEKSNNLTADLVAYRQRVDTVGSVAVLASNWSAKADTPHPNNMGGTYLPPPLLILPIPPAQKVKIDWLSFTSTIGFASLKVLVQCLFDDVHIDERSHGMPGYPSSSSLTVGGVPVGLIGHGAKHGKDFVSISGKGCSFWSSDFMSHVLDVLETGDCKLNRIDLALDFYDGEVSYDSCLAAYYAFEFQLPKSPSNPGSKEVGSQLNGVNLGRTLYVGSRKGAKFCRCYEKGLEVFSRLPQEYREACTSPGSLSVGFDGQLLTEQEQADLPVLTIADKWFRVEIEFKNTDTLLPLDMVINRDMYYAGAYPFTAKILGLSDGLRPSSLKTISEIDNEKMFTHARNGYGNAVHTWLGCGFTPQQIVERLDTGFHNQRLVKSGVLSSVKAVEDWDVPF